ncbi:hypothetical protein D3F01_15640 [Faecalibacterium sp. BCRC 81149]|nr:hypothetical protein [Faecalibacterium sp. BCRC 81149]RJV97522.1 hypothetical protein DW937_04625 [Faecalibacterium sp. AM43-5AT]
MYGLYLYALVRRILRKSSALSSVFRSFVRRTNRTDYLNSVRDFFKCVRSDQVRIVRTCRGEAPPSC